jgi:hypothetical protein
VIIINVGETTEMEPELDISEVNRALGDGWELCSIVSQHILT